MDDKHIGTPTNFRSIEGQEVNYRRTFDLNGTQNDETLRLYLRAAGLSDEIECLTAEQRRAFIYDIIRSNKLPGYWLPSTYYNSNSTMQRPRARPPPPPIQNAPTPYVEQRIENPNHYGTVRSNTSNDSQRSFGQASPILQHRFIPAPTTPPSPSTFVTSAKGKCYEISAPMNFEHTAGDMARDRTRNAFDLSASGNDNVLRKYMMERGITEEDIAGIRKADIIRKIVQSKFTWMPQKKAQKNNDLTIEQQLVFATVHRSSDATSILSDPSYEEIGVVSSPASPAPSPKPSPQGTLVKSKTGFSNYTLVTSRFADPSQFPAPNDLYSNEDYVNIAPATLVLPPLPPNAKTPAPPPRVNGKGNNTSKREECTLKDDLPPPPTTIMANNQYADSESFYQTVAARDYDNVIPTAQINRQNNKRHQQNIKQPTPFRQLTEPLYVTPPTHKPKAIPQSPPNTMNMQNEATQKNLFVAKTTQLQPTRTHSPAPFTAKNSNIDYLLPSALAAQQQKSPMATNLKNSAPLLNSTKPIPPIPPPPPPMPTESEYVNAAPGPMLAAEVMPAVTAVSPLPPPPPPPMPTVGECVYAAPGPMLTAGLMPAVGAVPPPPPPPPMNNSVTPSWTNSPKEKSPLPEVADNSRDALMESIRKGATLRATTKERSPKPEAADENGDAGHKTETKEQSPKPQAADGGRDAFLESIRKGVQLKKVNQKAATLSGTKPRAERKPPVQDFLSELRMGVTLRRVKNPADNPFSADEPDESQA